MKKTLLFAFISAATFGTSWADSVLSQDFNSFTDGALVGQGTWAQTGTIATNPIQVLSGDAVLGILGGQDAYVPFTSSIATLSAGDVVTTNLTISLTTATSGGDYFFHLSNPVGSSGNFYSRLYAKSSGSGFVLGFAPTSGTATYGTTELSFNTNITITSIWTVVAGANNDTFSLSVGGSSYLTGITFATGTEPTSLAAANLRQGGSTSSPGVTVRDISVDYTAAAVPEPATVALIGFGIGAVLIAGRRKRA